MSLFAELKRRNVIRMAGLYLVGAWLAVQVVQTMLPIFDAPGWIAKVLVALLAIGFVPVLVFSWLYELTPEGLKRDGGAMAAMSIATTTGRRMDRLIFVGLLALIALIAADRYWPREKMQPEASSNVGRSAQPDVAHAGKDADRVSAAAAPNAVAVLPFVNMSADKDNEFFSDGISEELLNVLVKVAGLDVASRTSSFAYKGRELGSRRIADELRVSYLLEGSVRKAGNKVRITAQLIDARHDRHLWSETYDRDLTDIFVIQDEIANAIVTAMRKELAVSTESLAKVKVQASTDNLPAYETYLKARELFIARRDLAESIRLFERAVELDPMFARGWEGLGAIASIADSWSLDDARDFTALAKHAARRALELDPTLSMPWAALGMAETNTMPSDWALALADMDKAIGADARNATAHLWRGIIWLNLGFFDRAMQDMERCLALEPSYFNCTRWKAMVLQHTDPDLALELVEQGVSKDFVGNRALDIAPLLHARGDRIGARLMLAATGIKVDFVNRMIAALDDPEAPPPVWSESLESMTGQRGANPVIYLWFGDFERLAAAPGATSDTIVAWQTVRPEWRNSPAFKRMLGRIGLTGYWRAHGFPPQCRALGTDDFECDATGSK